MLKYFDDLLLNAAQKFCDAVQRLLGFTKFRVEKWALITNMLSFCLFVAFALTPGAVASILIFGNVLSSVLSVKEIEHEEAEFLESGAIHYRLTNSRFFRLLPIAVLGPSTALFLETPLCGIFLSAFASFMAVVYISACLPRPPGKSKMREWCEKGLSWLNDRLPEVPAPVRA